MPIALLMPAKGRSQAWNLTAGGEAASFSRVPDMMLRAASFEALPNIRHAFFTRHGGVSGGLYASLNGGIGSRGHPPKRSEKRARLAPPGRARPLLTPHQVASPRGAPAETPWAREAAPRARAGA